MDDEEKTDSDIFPSDCDLIFGNRNIFQSKLKYDSIWEFITGFATAGKLLVGKIIIVLKRRYLAIVKPEVAGMWRTGRRIVDFGVLAEKMFCAACNVPLHLKDTIGERTVGFGSTLFILCTNTNCGTVTDVPTGKLSSRGDQDITDKVIIGAISAGLGYTHVRCFLSALNMPIMSKSCFQRHEKKMGKINAEAAKESGSRDIEIDQESPGAQGFEGSFDTECQKNEPGFSPNNKTGHVAMDGRKPEKGASLNTKSVCCKMCDHYEGKQLLIPDHDCPRIRSGEPDIAVTMAHKIEDDGDQKHVLRANNELAKPNLNVPYMMKKDDKNHITKGITEPLIELSKRHKDLKPAGVIPYLNRCYMCAVLQNKDDDTMIDKALSRIVPHVYGDHELCEEVDWCTYKNDPESFKYKSLPEGKPLTDTLLRKDLEELIEKYKRKSHPGSARANTETANETKVMSAGEFTHRPSENNKKEQLSISKKPTSHQSGVMVDTFGLLDILDTLTIPMSPLQLDGDESLVFFDLETTGLSRTSDITQIAAICNLSLFQQYALPRCEITGGASKVTGITCCLATKKLYVKGEAVPCGSQLEVLQNFIEFLKKLNKPILVGHNICNFDIAIISNKLKEFGLFSTFKDIIKGYIDTLKVAKIIFPKTKVGEYKQTSLVMKFIGTDYEAHNAAEDVMSLKKLYEQEMKVKVNHDNLYSLTYRMCKDSFDILVKEKVISKDVCEKLSRSGISLLHLRAAHQRDPKAISHILQNFKISPSKLEPNLLSFFENEQ